MFGGGEHVAVIGIDFPEAILLGTGEMQCVHCSEEDRGGSFSYRWQALSMICLSGSIHAQIPTEQSERNCLMTVSYTHLTLPTNREV